MQKTKQQRNKVHQNLKIINHFNCELPLPETVSIYEYVPKFSDSKKKKKLKHKYQSFTYYQEILSGIIHKILFISDEQYIDQGIYPFTQPEGKIKEFKSLNVKRVNVTEAAYIGHIRDEVIFKKIDGVNIGENGSQFETTDDQFQVLRIGNEKRFNQFVKLMSVNKNSLNMSIRIMIKESQEQKPQIIDYEFFYRQKQLTKKNQKNTGIQQK